MRHSPSSARFVRMAVAVVLLPATRVLGAQTPLPADARGEVARIHTPAGGLAPLPLPPLVDSAGLGAGLQLQIGVVERPLQPITGDRTVSDSHEELYALALDVPLARRGAMARVRLGTTAGVITAECSDASGLRACDPGVTAGVSVRGAVWGARGTGAGAPAVGVGLEGDYGFGRQQTNGHALGASAPLWIALRFHRHYWSSESDPRFRPRTVFFVAPGVSMAWLTDGVGTTHAALGELTAGASVLEIGPGFGVTFAARKTVTAAGHLRITFGLSWRRTGAG